MYHKFLEINQESSVSHGTFLALKPFYLRSATTKDIKMCCCKKHLHIRWLVKALTDCAAKQTLALVSFNDYNSFFNHLTKDCIKKKSTYINWDCTIDKYTVCDDIKKTWDNLKDCILNEDNRVTKVPMQHFEKIETISKYGKTTKWLKAISTSANIAFITNFIDERLTKITSS